MSLSSGKVLLKQALFIRPASHGVTKNNMDLHHLFTNLFSTFISHFQQNTVQLEDSGKPIPARTENRFFP